LRSFTLERGADGVVVLEIHACAHARASPVEWLVGAPLAVLGQSLLQELRSELTERPPLVALAAAELAEDDGVDVECRTGDESDASSARI
jgi:hypothetical protein